MPNRGESKYLKGQLQQANQRITELESELATVMPLLAKLYDWCAEIGGPYPTPEEDRDYLQTCEQVDGLLTAWQARQSVVPAGDSNENGA